MTLRKTKTFYTETVPRLCIREMITLVNVALYLAAKWRSKWSWTRSIPGWRDLPFGDYINSAEIWCSFWYTAWNIWNLESSVRKIYNMQLVIICTDSYVCEFQIFSYELLWETMTYTTISKHGLRETLRHQGGRLADTNLSATTLGSLPILIFYSSYLMFVHFNKL